MDSGWINQLLLLNTRIVASEARLIAHVDKMRKLSVRGRDTSEIA
jgi:hypothetical protein